MALYYLKRDSSVGKQLFLAVSGGNLLKNIDVKTETWQLDSYLICLFHLHFYPWKDWNCLLFRSTGCSSCGGLRDWTLQWHCSLGLAVVLLDADPELISPEFEIIKSHKTREQ